MYPGLCYSCSDLIGSQGNAKEVGHTGLTLSSEGVVRIIEYHGGPADGKLEAVSNNGCAEILYLERASIEMANWDAYLYKFDGFAMNGRLEFKFVSKVSSDYKCRKGFGPSVETELCIAQPLRVEC